MRSRNPARYELDIMTLYENQSTANIFHQAAILVMQDAMKHWDACKADKDLMERWVSDFFAKARCLRVAMAARQGFNVNLDEPGFNFTSAVCGLEELRMTTSRVL